MKNVISFCGKRIPTERTFTALNWPHYGDITEIFMALWLEPPNERNVYAYYTIGLDGKSCELMQADKHTRAKFDDMLNQGTLIEHQREDKGDKRPTRGQPFVGDYTKRICRPAEHNIKPHILRQLAKSKEPSNLEPTPYAV